MELVTIRETSAQLPDLPDQAELARVETLSAAAASLSRFVLAHRLLPADPLAPEEAAWEAPAATALLGTKRADMSQAARLLA